MASQTPDPWLTEAARRRVAEFTANLRTATGPSAPVPGLDWTVAELAQHVASLPGFWNTQHVAASKWEIPADFAAYSDAVRAHIIEPAIAPLAATIDAEFDRFITELTHDQDQRWLYGVPTTTTNMCGLILNEIILHGRDLAAITRAPMPKFDRAEANVAVDAMMVTIPCFIDEDKAATQPDGTYHLRFRGGQHYTWTKSGNTLSVKHGRPNRADAHLNADPATFVMASLGRISQIRAGLSGKMIAYGWRPWRFYGLGKIAVDGV